MASWESSKTLIRRVRVRGSGLDPTLARLRLATLLSGAHLSPAELSPSAILCVRHLRGPVPDSLSPLAAGGILSRDWERAVAAALGKLARHAARPAHGAVPANTEAVLFAEQAELLACLVSDYCDGSAATRWWWPNLFRGADVSPVRALQDAPACIPAALEHLAHRGKAVVFMCTLNPGEAHALLLSIVRVFALPYLRAALDAALHARHEAREEGERGDLEAPRDFYLQQGGQTAQTFEDTEDSSAQRAPWRTVVPEGAGLAPEQQTLLGVGLMLMRAPTFVRTQIFARATQRWLLKAVASFDGKHAVATTRPLFDGAHAPLETRPLVDLTSAHRRTTRAPRAVAREESSIVASFAEPMNDTVSSEIELEAGIERFHPADVEPANQPQASPVEYPGDARMSSETDHAATFQKSESDVESLPLVSFTDEVQVERYAATRWSEESTPCFETADTERVHAAYVETKLGGIFYLINLALFLELYGDFTSPAAPGIPLNLWDFLALAGAELAGESFHPDPLRTLLAQLAGRGETEAPGAGFVPPDEWRVPSTWLQPFAAHAKLTWTARAKRLRVHHPEGFLLLDLPLKRTDARAHLAREIEAYRDHLSFELRHKRTSERAQDVKEADALKRWGARLMAYARARLRRALGLESVDHLSKVLCEQPARVLASATRVDVFFSLAALPIEVRQSGIDRDPGWVPAAGRFIAFHYE